MAVNSSMHVLIVDDDADTRDNLSDILQLDDHRVETAGTLAEALDGTATERMGVLLRRE